MGIFPFSEFSIAIGHYGKACLLNKSKVGPFFANEQNLNFYFEFKYKLQVDVPQKPQKKHIIIFRLKKMSKINKKYMS